MMGARRLMPLAALVATTVIVPAALRAAPAQASAGYIGGRILDQAETRVNDSYVYGADGPYYFDCSGLVAWAARAAGQSSWPRDTYEIQAEIGTRFSVTDHPVRGDLAVWADASGVIYHVEFVTIWRDTTFGTEQPGWAGRVTWHDDAYFEPSYYLRIRY